MPETLEMTRLLRRLIWFSLGALLLVGATVGGFFLSQGRAQRAFTQKREISRIGRTAAALATDRETGIRGYQLTHDQKSLVPEIIGRARLPGKLDSLAALTSSDSANVRRVQAISTALERWETEFAEPAIRGEVRGDSMLAGKPQFDQVRAAFDTFLSASEADLLREAARVRSLQILGVALVLAELLAFVGILLFIIRGRLMRQARELGHQQELLEQQAVELELQMAEMQATTDSLAEREETLRKSEERYRYAARVSNDAIYDWDVTSNRFEWNEGLQGLFGYPAEEIGTTIEWIVSLLHPEDTDRVMGTFYAVFNKGGGSQWKADYRLRRKDGKYANAEGRAYIIRAADGTPKRVIGAISDHTQQQSLEGQLRQSQKMEAIGRLAGGIAHDFNNILTVIRMSSEFLLTDMHESDEKFQDATEIMKASDRASKLTRQLLAFSRHQVLNPTVLNLNEIVSGMDGMVRRVVAENIELVTDLAPDLRSVKADVGQMEQVLLNLVINAADAMPEGGRLSIRTSNTAIDATFSAKHLDVPPGQYVSLTVTDTGIGMDEETVARIFEPFFTTKGVGKGTGLGLSTVHGIVTQSGGTVWVYSEPALGTTFKIFLPRAEGTSTPTSTRIVEEPAAPPNETVLLVEDEEATRVAIHRNLARVGYTVVDAPNGIEALRLADSYPGTIDLLLTDSMMPEMGGAELVKQLRKQRPGISVLMMSGYTEDLAPTGGDGENEFFIEKPFNTADLLLAIRSAVRAGK
jgi:two-component system, cell cycle sensor histidine kinase and response regulator CckA